MSFVKTLLTKKVYDQKRLENAIRNTAAGVSAVGVAGLGAGGTVARAEEPTNSSNPADQSSNGHSLKRPVGSLEEAGTNQAGGAAGQANGESATKVQVQVRGRAGDDGDNEDDEDVVERTELEVATEAAVVRARGVGREARKELRQSMTRCGVFTLFSPEVGGLEPNVRSSDGS